jgi:hypothetical protein
LGSASDLIVLAPIRGGLVQSYEAVAPATRLALTLRTLAAIRTAAREQAPLQVFSDPVERIRQVHSYRVALLPDPARFLLAVTFDHSWEPYMRALWLDAGPLLDLLLTNCEGYPLARTASLTTWSAWVRAHEVPAEFFYSATPLTVSDLAYLSALEEESRAGKPELDLIGVFARRPEEITRANRAAVAGAADRLIHAPALETLDALFRLTRYHGAMAGTLDADTLLRAAHAILKDWEPPASVPAAYAQQKAWYDQLPDAPPAPSPAISWTPEGVQKGVLSAYDTPVQPVTHGAVLFLEVTDPDAARTSLADLADLLDVEGAKAPADGVWRTLALTWPGFQRLKIANPTLDALPPEFRQGAAARAGQVGDVRSFHPRFWQPLPRNWPAAGAGAVDWAAVDVIVQLRTSAPANHAHTMCRGNPLYDAVDAIAGLDGLRLLSVDTLKRRGLGDDDRDHFGLRDGISQPDPFATPPATGWSDAVAPGEIVLGAPEADGHVADVPAFLRHGSFLALRRMRMWPDRFQTMTGGCPVATTAILGRAADGTSPISGLVDNAFDYAGDPAGHRVPRQSHVRRANPRLDRRPDERPRIMRRGMSFGPPDPKEAGDRGILFMGYCASLAEQFEVVLRWVNGGNSTDLGSCLSDPLCGTPSLGERDYRHRMGGTVSRIKLKGAADAPVTLDWMLYAFAPSVEALKGLRSAEATQPEAGEAVERGLGIIERLKGAPAESWQTLLDDPGARVRGDTAAFWAAVRARHDGVLASPLGTLVGRSDRILAVLGDTKGRYSVCGYQERFLQSTGPLYLGMDGNDPDYAAQATAGNNAIATVTQRAAWDATVAATARTLAALRKPSRIDLLRDLIDPVMAAICPAWFDFPDGKHIISGGLDWRMPKGPFFPDGRTPQCPGDFYSPSRYFFDPTPSGTGVTAGRLHGRALREAALAMTSRHSFSGTVSKALRGAPPFDRDDTLFAGSLAGIAIGFLPTTVGNLVNAIPALAESGKLFRLREAWAAAPTRDLAAAECQLLPALARAIKANPAPDFIWRTATVEHELAGTVVPAGGRILLSIQSATQGELAAGDLGLDLLFGGRRPGGPLHACPGRAMAMGTMLGFLCGFLSADVAAGSGPLSFDLR